MEELGLASIHADENLCDVQHNRMYSVRWLVKAQRRDSKPTVVDYDGVEDANTTGERA